MIGFETIGNATIICYDDLPLLVTDPWIVGSAYFGSWGMTHAVPSAQMDSIQRGPYIWFSHAHPDHLNSESLANLSDKQILLPDHVGRRVYDDLTQLGFRCRILPERQWVTLSNRIRIFCASDHYQDAVLLIDINGTLLINLNDCIDRGWGRILRKITRNYKTVYLLKTCGFGDIDMMNFFSEDGQRIPPKAAITRETCQIGKILGLYANLYHATHVVPFSSFHNYQREDSVWAREYQTPLSAFKIGFAAKHSEIFDPFVRVDCESGSLENIWPAPNPGVILPSQAFGDNWTDQLEGDEKTQVRDYIQRKELLYDYFGFVTFSCRRQRYCRGSESATPTSWHHLRGAAQFPDDSGYT